MNVKRFEFFVVFWWFFVFMLFVSGSCLTLSFVSFSFWDLGFGASF